MKRLGFSETVRLHVWWTIGVAALLLVGWLAQAHALDRPKASPVEINVFHACLYVVDNMVDCAQIMQKYTLSEQMDFTKDEWLCANSVSPQECVDARGEE